MKPTWASKNAAAKEGKKLLDYYFAESPDVKGCRRIRNPRDRIKFLNLKDRIEILNSKDDEKFIYQNERKDNRNKKREKMIIKGRTKYIQHFKNMKKRAEATLNEKSWLKKPSKKWSKLSEKSNTILNVIETLDCLIKEQESYLSRISTKGNSTQNKPFNFFYKTSYSTETLTKWLDEAPQIKESIIIKKDPNNKRKK
ncbi:hypothetical protein [Acinetobacter sp. NIPH 2699]|uniref:hypothetical protein n=1 Tax=Acinetobacter sp. NIPH 2699 TaxID=2923433 RepID=UPI001F4BB0FE|nr:hypothetical protein [Acinetobacter sp. NIPH 2699]MCH7337625.1 hypothetical protein [Acinetobacter sp. NIPH 2699]